MKADTMLEVKTDIVTVLIASGYSFYNEVAPPDSVYPFVTFEINNSFADDSTEQVILYLDGWDLFSRTSSTMELETMMSDILKLLQHRKHVVSNNFGFWYNLDSRKDLRDPESDIRRRRHQYQIRVFGRE